MKGTKTINRRIFIRSSFVMTGLGLNFNLYSCEKKANSKTPDDDSDLEIRDPNNKLSITNIDLPTQLNVKKGGEFKIRGEGFEAGDQLTFSSLTGNANNSNTLDSKEVTDTHIICQMPEDFASDGYKISVKRGGNLFYLGDSVLDLVFNPDIPDREGMTVKGVVYAEGKGLKDVVVSDGFEVAVTDKNGVYYLPSQKKGKYVFVSIPGNYEVGVEEENSPLFFNRLTQPVSTVEIKDFELFPVQNDDHVMMVLGDMHLANRNNDIKQFQNDFLRDVNQSIREYENTGKKVYALTLGDMTWDTYWYSKDYALPDYLREKKKIGAPVFHTMGNHDNDPNYSYNDWQAEERYRNVIGPTYYSFNIGKAHYVVLDNTEYINDVDNDNPRSYNAKIVQEQIDWLKKDLAMISDKSAPLIIAMHIQLNSNPSLNANGQEMTSWRLDDPNKFLDVLNGFSNVHLLTAHTHMNYNIQTSSTVMEHNIAAVCATWWWTGKDGYAGNHICKDGSPGGYDIWEVEGTNLKWCYKGIGHNKDYQFRAYDLNEVHITSNKYAPNYTGTEWDKYAEGYTSPNTKNEVLINVWNYAQGWKVEVTENGKPLHVTRVRVRDPLHIISYNAQRLERNADPTSAFTSALTAHMFKVTASNATSTLKIKVTDNFGNVYIEDMVRPKAFDEKIK